MKIERRTFLLGTLTLLPLAAGCGGGGEPGPAVYGSNLPPAEKEAEDRMIAEQEKRRAGKAK